MKRFAIVSLVLLISFLILRVEGISSGLWSDEEWRNARTFSPLSPPPANPTNRFATSEQAARLGHRLFFDSRLSPKGFSCASCHKPEKGFTDGLVVANTIAPLHRNTMTILNVGQYRWLTWDGARDSLWHQALAPIENPKEMGSSRLYVVKAVMRHYGRELAPLIEFAEGFETLWPTLPGHGKPGDPQYENLSEARKQTVNRVFAAILKLIAAYEMKIVSGEAPFDRFVAGDSKALTSSAQRGFQHFLRLGCDICHNTPLFSDDEFHNLGLEPVPEPDPGRFQGLKTLKASPFRGTGPYADDAPVVKAEDYSSGKALLGTFRTPSLRELKHTAPYGHNGSIESLEKWLDHYVTVTSSRKGNFLGKLDPALPQVRLTDIEKKELSDFLLSLSSKYGSEWARKPAELRSLPVAR